MPDGLAEPVPVDEVENEAVGEKESESVDVRDSLMDRVYVAVGELDTLEDPLEEAIEL